MGELFISPAYQVRRVPIEKIRANSYNPNKTAPTEFKLLERSILEDGYTMPIVCYYDKENDTYEIVDGFHRYLVMKNSETIAQREGNCLPVSVIDRPLEDRIASTIRHNRARGTHSVELMTEIVQQLVEAGLSDRWIMTNIGMDKEELLRLKQLSGLASLFKGGEFSRSWEWDKEEQSVVKATLFFIYIFRFVKSIAIHRCVIIGQVFVIFIGKINFRVNPLTIFH